MIQQSLEAVNAGMSTYRPDSELSRINDAGQGCYPLSDSLRWVIEESLSLYHNSGGAFDVTVGPLVDLWGFGSTERDNKVPDSVLLTETQKSIGTDKLSIRDDQLCKASDSIRIDLSAIAKGFAVDQVVGILQTEEVANYLVEIGGELRVAGTRGDGTAWRVAVERPDPARRAVFGVLEMTEGAVATSGEYRNFFTYEGKQYSHTLDPRTGWPVSHPQGSVTVVHESAMTADGLATALNVMGREEGLKWANERQLSVLYLESEGEDFKEYPSNAFRQRFPDIH